MDMFEFHRQLALDNIQIYHDSSPGVFECDAALDIQIERFSNGEIVLDDELNKLIDDLLSRRRSFTSSFMRLPAEMRVQIYRQVFEATGQHKLTHPLTTVSKQVRNECLPFLMQHLNMTIEVCSFCLKRRNDEHGLCGHDPCNEKLFYAGISFSPANELIIARYSSKPIPVTHPWSNLYKTPIPDLMRMCGSVTLDCIDRAIVNIKAKRNELPEISYQQVEMTHLAARLRRKEEQLGKSRPTMESQIDSLVSKWKALPNTTTLSVEFVGAIAGDMVKLPRQIYRRRFESKPRNTIEAREHVEQASTTHISLF